MPDAPGLATRTILSPNHYSGWTKGPPTAVVIHSTRSGQASFTDALELQATINWFSKVSSQASAHWVISELERVRVVDDRYPAWHAVEHSWDAYGIEVCQPTRDRPYKEGHYTNLVKVCLPYVRAGIPVVHLPSMVSPGSAAGFIGHDKTAQGLRDGKSDPGLLFNWPKFLTMLKEGGADVLTPTDEARVAALEKAMKLLVAEDLADDTLEVALQKRNAYLANAGVVITKAMTLIQAGSSRVAVLDALITEANRVKADIVAGKY